MSNMASDKVPGKVNNSGLFEEKIVMSKDFQQDILPAIQESYLYPESKDKFSYFQCQIVHNKTLLEKYEEKCQEIVDSYNRDFRESYAFLCVESQQEAEKICQEGLKIGNKSYSCLGPARMGVQLCRYADILSPAPLINGSTYSLIVFKVLKSHVKSLSENHINTIQDLRPMPGYDCHQTSGIPFTGLSPLKLFQYTQIYLYDYKDGQIVERPCHVCPVAVVQFHYRDHKDIEKSRGGLINMTKKVGIRKGREKYLRDVSTLTAGVSTLTAGKEFYNNGWYINVCLMKPVQPKSNFEKIRHYLIDNKCMAVVKVEEDILLVMTDNELTVQLGLTLHSQCSDLHCLFLSRYSQKNKGSLMTDRAGETAQSTDVSQLCSSTHGGHVRNSSRQSYSRHNRERWRADNSCHIPPVCTSVVPIKDESNRLTDANNNSNVQQVVAQNRSGGNHSIQDAFYVKMDESSSIEEMDIIESSRSPFPDTYSNVRVGTGDLTSVIIGSHDEMAVSHQFQPSPGYSSKLAEALSLSSQESDQISDDLPPLIPWLPVNISQSILPPVPSTSELHSSSLDAITSHQNNVRHNQIFTKNPQNNTKCQLASQLRKTGDSGTPPPTLPVESNCKVYESSENSLSRPPSLEYVGDLPDESAQRVSSKKLDFEKGKNIGLSLPETLEPGLSTQQNCLQRENNFSSSGLLFSSAPRHFMDALMEPVKKKAMFTPEHAQEQVGNFTAPYSPVIQTWESQENPALETNGIAIKQEPICEMISHLEESNSQYLRINRCYPEHMDCLSCPLIKEEPVEVQDQWLQNSPGFQDSPVLKLHPSASLPDIFGQSKAQNSFHVERPQLLQLLDSGFWPKAPWTSLLKSATLRDSFAEQEKANSQKIKGLHRTRSLVDLKKLSEMYTDRKVDLLVNSSEDLIRTVAVRNHNKSNISNYKSSDTGERDSMCAGSSRHDISKETVDSACNQSGSQAVVRIDSASSLIDQMSKYAPKVVLKKLRLDDNKTVSMESKTSTPGSLKLKIKLTPEIRGNDVAMEGIEKSVHRDTKHDMEITEGNTYASAKIHQQERGKERNQNDRDKAEHLKSSVGECQERKEEGHIKGSCEEEGHLEQSVGSNDKPKDNKREASEEMMVFKDAMYSIKQTESSHSNKESDYNMTSPVHHKKHKHGKNKEKRSKHSHNHKEKVFNADKKENKKEHTPTQVYSTKKDAIKDGKDRNDEMASSKVNSLCSKVRESTGGIKRKADEDETRSETNEKKLKTGDFESVKEKRKHSETKPEKTNKKDKKSRAKSSVLTKQQAADEVLSALNMGISRQDVSSLGRIPKKQSDSSKKSKRNGGKDKDTETYIQEMTEECGLPKEMPESRTSDNLKEGKLKSHKKHIDKVKPTDPMTNTTDPVIPKLEPVESDAQVDETKSKKCVSIVYSRKKHNSSETLIGRGPISASDDLLPESNLDGFMQKQKPLSKVTESAKTSWTETDNSIFSNVMQTRPKGDTIPGLGGFESITDLQETANGWVDCSKRQVVKSESGLKCVLSGYSPVNGGSQKVDIVECLKAALHRVRNTTQASKTDTIVKSIHEGLHGSREWEGKRTFSKSVDSKGISVVSVKMGTENEADKLANKDGEKVTDTGGGSSDMDIRKAACAGNSLSQVPEEDETRQSNGHTKHAYDHAGKPAANQTVFESNTSSKEGQKQSGSPDNTNPMVIEVTLKEKRKDSNVVKKSSGKDQTINVTVQIGKIELADRNRPSSRNEAVLDPRKDSNTKTESGYSGKHPKGKGGEAITKNNNDLEETMEGLISRRRSRSKSRSKEDGQSSVSQSKTSNESKSSSSQEKSLSKEASSSRAGSEGREEKSSGQRSRHGSGAGILRTESKAESRKTEKTIAERLETLASKSIPTSEQAKAESRHSRQYHPYKKEEKKKRSKKPKWSFDMAYRDMNELLQNLTTSFFREFNRCPAPVPGSLDMKRKPRRFAGFKFQRSDIPQTPPRSRSPSPTDDPESNRLGPEVIPDLKEREKTADLLEDMFLEIVEEVEEEEYSREQDIYGKEEMEDGIESGSLTDGENKNLKNDNRSDQKTVSLKSENCVALVIPGGPKTSVYSTTELNEDSEASLELLDGPSARPLQTEVTVSLPKPSSENDKADKQRSLLESGIEEGKNKLPIVHTPEKKQNNSNSHIKGLLHVLKTGDSESNLQLQEDNCSNTLESSKDTQVSENTKNGKSEAQDVLDQEPSESDTFSDKAVECALESKKKKDRAALLSADSDSCLDWTDEELALDKLDENAAFASNDDLSDTGEVKSYFVLDSVGGSDSESLEDLKQKTVPQSPEKKVKKLETKTNNDSKDLFLDKTNKPKNNEEVALNSGDSQATNKLEFHILDCEENKIKATVKPENSGSEEADLYKLVSQTCTNEVCHTSNSVGPHTTMLKEETEIMINRSHRCTNENTQIIDNEPDYVHVHDKKARSTEKPYKIVSGGCEIDKIKLPIIMNDTQMVKIGKVDTCISNENESLAEIKCIKSVRSNELARERPNLPLRQEMSSVENKTSISSVLSFKDHENTSSKPSHLYSSEETDKEPFQKESEHQIIEMTYLDDSITKSSNVSLETGSILQYDRQKEVVLAADSAAVEVEIDTDSVHNVPLVAVEVEVSNMYGDGIDTHSQDSTHVWSYFSVHDTEKAQCEAVIDLNTNIEVSLGKDEEINEKTQEKLYTVVDEAVNTEDNVIAIFEEDANGCMKEVVGIIKSGLDSPEPNENTIPDGITFDNVGQAIPLTVCNADTKGTDSCDTNLHLDDGNDEAKLHLSDQIISQKINDINSTQSSKLPDTKGVPGSGVDIIITKQNELETKTDSQRHSVEACSQLLQASFGKPSVSLGDYLPVMSSRPFQNIKSVYTTVCKSDSYDCVEKNQTVDTHLSVSQLPSLLENSVLEEKKQPDQIHQAADHLPVMSAFSELSSHASLDESQQSDQESTEKCSAALSETITEKKQECDVALVAQKLVSDKNCDQTQPLETEDNDMPTNKSQGSPFSVEDESSARAIATIAPLRSDPFLAVSNYEVDFNETEGHCFVTSSHSQSLPGFLPMSVGPQQGLTPNRFLNSASVCPNPSFMRGRNLYRFTNSDLNEMAYFRQPYQTSWHNISSLSPISSQTFTGLIPQSLAAYRSPVWQNSYLQYRTSSVQLNQGFDSFAGQLLPWMFSFRVSPNFNQNNPNTYLAFEQSRTVSWPYNHLYSCFSNSFENNSLKDWATLPETLVLGSENSRTVEYENDFRQCHGGKEILGVHKATNKCLKKTKDSATGSGSSGTSLKVGCETSINKKQSDKLWGNAITELDEVQSLSKSENEMNLDIQEHETLIPNCHSDRNNFPGSKDRHSETDSIEIFDSPVSTKCIQATVSARMVNNSNNVKQETSSVCTEKSLSSSVVALGPEYIILKHANSKVVCKKVNRSDDHTSFGPVSSTDCYKMQKNIGVCDNWSSFSERSIGDTGIDEQKLNEKEQSVSVNCDVKTQLTHIKSKCKDCYSNCIETINCHNSLQNTKEKASFGCREIIDKPNHSNLSTDASNDLLPEIYKEQIADSVINWADSADLSHALNGHLSLSRDNEAQFLATDEPENIVHSIEKAIILTKEKASEKNNNHVLAFEKDKISNIENATCMEEKDCNGELSCGRKKIPDEATLVTAEKNYCEDELKYFYKSISPLLLAADITECHKALDLKRKELNEESKKRDVIERREETQNSECVVTQKHKPEGKTCQLLTTDDSSIIKEETICGSETIDKDSRIHSLTTAGDLSISGDGVEKTVFMPSKQIDNIIERETLQFKAEIAPSISDTVLAQCSQDAQSNTSNTHFKCDGHNNAELNKVAPDSHRNHGNKISNIGKESVIHRIKSVGLTDNIKNDNKLQFEAYNEKESTETNSTANYIWNGKIIQSQETVESGNRKCSETEKTSEKRCSDVDTDSMSIIHDMSLSNSIQDTQRSKDQGLHKKKNKILKGEKSSSAAARIVSSEKLNLHKPAEINGSAGTVSGPQQRTSKSKKRVEQKKYKSRQKKNKVNLDQAVALFYRELSLIQPKVNLSESLSRKRGLVDYDDDADEECLNKLNKDTHSYVDLVVHTDDNNGDAVEIGKDDSHQNLKNERESSFKTKESQLKTGDNILPQHLLDSGSSLEVANNKEWTGSSLCGSNSGQSGNVYEDDCHYDLIEKPDIFLMGLSYESLKRELHEMKCKYNDDRGSNSLKIHQTVESMKEPVVDYVDSASSTDTVSNFIENQGPLEADLTEKSLLAGLDIHHEENRWIKLHSPADKRTLDTTPTEIVQAPKNTHNSLGKSEDVITGASDTFTAPVREEYQSSERGMAIAALCHENSGRVLTDEEVENWDTCPAASLSKEQSIGSNRTIKSSISLLSSAYDESSNESCDILTERKARKKSENPSNDFQDSLSALKSYLNDSNSSDSCSVSDECDNTDSQESHVQEVSSISSSTNGRGRGSDESTEPENKAEKELCPAEMDSYLHCKWVDTGILSPDNSDTESICDTASSSPDTLKAVSDSDELYQSDSVAKLSLCSTKRRGLDNLEKVDSSDRRGYITETVNQSVHSDSSHLNVFDSSGPDSPVSNISSLSLSVLEERRKRLERILKENDTDSSQKVDSEKDIVVNISKAVSHVSDKIPSHAPDKVADIQSWIQTGKEETHILRKLLAEKLQEDWDSSSSEYESSASFRKNGSISNEYLGLDNVSDSEKSWKSCSESSRGLQSDSQLSKQARADLESFQLPFHNDNIDPSPTLRDAREVIVKSKNQQYASNPKQTRYYLYNYRDIRIPMSGSNDRSYPGLERHCRKNSVGKRSKSGSRASEVSSEGRGDLDVDRSENKSKQNCDNGRMPSSDISRRERLRSDHSSHHIRLQSKDRSAVLDREQCEKYLSDKDSKRSRCSRSKTRKEEQYLRDSKRYSWLRKRSNSPSNSSWSRKDRSRSRQRSRSPERGRPVSRSRKEAVKLLNETKHSLRDEGSRVATELLSACQRDERLYVRSYDNAYTSSDRKYISGQMEMHFHNYRTTGDVTRQRQTISVKQNEKVVILNSSALAYEKLEDIGILIKSLVQFSTSTCHWKALIHSRMVCDLDEWRSGNPGCSEILKLLSDFREDGHVELLPFHGCDDNSQSAIQCAEQLTDQRSNIRITYLIAGNQFGAQKKKRPVGPSVSMENSVKQLDLLTKGLVYRCVHEPSAGSSNEFTCSVDIDRDTYTGSGKSKKLAKRAAAKAALIGKFKILTVPTSGSLYTSDPRIVVCSIKKFLDLHLTSKNV